MNKIKEQFRKAIRRQIADDFQRKREQLIILLVALGTISLGMAILNLITKKTELLAATALFALFSYIAAFIGHKDKKSMKWTTALFVIEIAVLFTYFIVTGGTEGFSTIWLLMLPSCGLFAFDKRNGSIMTGALFAELIFFFYTPWGKSLLVCKDYTKSFLTRFPILYLAFWLVAFFLEYVREGTYRQLKYSQENFEYLSSHDALTGLYNRAGFNNEIEIAEKRAKAGEEFALLIIDIDDFKLVNDDFGHQKGDEVLQIVSFVIKKFLNKNLSSVCRWGGEEFAILLFGKCAENYKNYAEELRILIHETIVEKEEGIKNTVSIGAVNANQIEPFSSDKMFSVADKMLYKAKQNGKNQVVSL